MQSNPSTQTSQPTTIPTTSPELPSSLPGLTSKILQFSDMPIINLIGTQVHELTEEELRAYVLTCRAKRTSAQTLRAALKAESDVLEKKVPARKSVQSKANDLLRDLGLD